MSTALTVSVAVLFVVAAGVSVVAWWAAVRSRRLRLGLLATGFSCVAAAGGASASLLWRGSTADVALGVQSALVAAGLVFIYWAAVKR